MGEAVTQNHTQIRLFDNNDIMCARGGGLKARYLTIMYFLDPPLQYNLYYKIFPQDDWAGLRSNPVTKLEVKHGTYYTW